MYNWLYKQTATIPQARANFVSIDIPVPIGWLNTSVPSQQIQDNEVSNELNMWINSEWRYAPFYWQTAFSSVLWSWSQIVELFKYKKTESTKYNIVAWDDWANLKLWYLSALWVYTSIDATLTHWDTIVFETYLNRSGTLLFPLSWTKTATSWTSTTLVDWSETFITNVYKGKILVITAWTWVGQWRIIQTNNATTITVLSEFRTNPDTTSQYEVRETAYSLYYLTPTAWLKAWDWTTVTSISTAPKGNTIRIFKDIMFIGKDSALYASYAYDPTDWSNPYYGVIGNQDPNDITAIENYKGQLIVFKENSSIVVQPSIDATTWIFDFFQWEIDFTRWCKNSKTLCSMDGELMVCDILGTYMYWYADKIQIIWVQRRTSDKIYNEIIDQTITGLYYDKRNDLVYLMTTTNTYLYDWSRKAVTDWWHKTDLKLTTLLDFDNVIYLWYLDEWRVYKLDETKAMTWAYSVTKDFEMWHDFPKIFDFMKFSAKNVMWYIWLQAIISSAHWVQIIRDASINLHQPWGFWGGVWVAPVWVAPIGWLWLATPLSLNFVKRRVPFPQYQVSYIKIKWYNDLNSNFELEKYSLHFEALSVSHDPMSIYA